MYVKSSSNCPTKFLLFTRENIWLIVLEQKCIIYEKIKIHRSTWIRNKLIIYNFYFYYTQSSYSPIISYHRIYFPIISQTQFLLSHKKKHPYHYFLTRTTLEKNCPVTLLFNHPLFALSYRAVQSDCNLINRSIRLPT